MKSAVLFALFFFSPLLASSGNDVCSQYSGKNTGKWISYMSTHPSDYTSATAGCQSKVLDELTSADPKHIEPALRKAKGSISHVCKAVVKLHKQRDNDRAAKKRYKNAINTVCSFISHSGKKSPNFDQCLKKVLDVKKGYCKEYLE